MKILNTTIILNDDKNRVIITDYFDSPVSKNGYFYMKHDKDGYYLLVPETNTDFVKEVLHASRVIINRGATEQLDTPVKDAFEIIFEDRTDNPYAILMKAEFWESYPEKDDMGWKGVMKIYCDPLEPKLLFDKVFYREVDTLPCYDPVPDKVKEYDDPSNWEYE